MKVTPYFLLSLPSVKVTLHTFASLPDSEGRLPSWLVALYVQSPVLVVCWQRAAALLPQHHQCLISVLLLYQPEYG